MPKHQTREEVLATIREKLGGYGAGQRVSKIALVSKIAGAKWLRDGIPRERVPLFSALTGQPDYIIRPDLFVPPVPAGREAKASNQSHGASVSGGARV